MIHIYVESVMMIYIRLNFRIRLEAFFEEEQEKLLSERDLKRKAKLDEINVLKKKKVEVSKSIDILKTSLTSAAIASGSAGNKGRENAVQAAAFATEMQAKEVLLEELHGAEKKLEDEYKALQM